MPSSVRTSLPDPQVLVVVKPITWRSFSSREAPLSRRAQSPPAPPYIECHWSSEIRPLLSNGPDGVVIHHGILPVVHAPLLLRQKSTIGRTNQGACPSSPWWWEVNDPPYQWRGWFLAWMLSNREPHPLPLSQGGGACISRERIVVLVVSLSLESVGGISSVVAVAQPSSSEGKEIYSSWGLASLCKPCLLGARLAVLMLCVEREDRRWNQMGRSRDKRYRDIVCRLLDRHRTVSYLFDLRLVPESATNQRISSPSCNYLVMDLFRSNIYID